ncbi:hypothetical protein CEUSTIGMA_g10057.t1 [Chlamydomonas eustigma]|uniref:Uncharacterized protein n=1 Tax=Chlamydomonas eustigma TaxID=1157962 RepID=A0A250XHS8_9CHLO|nr:hypothetical protein CEUSTIGMA_g10057.t1 [Chlamydomonas eustigma]|eukprot:GAX82631.1 hypothetical protein CEUSTIGMA_g10057.t1 [Chlamydomonas eustigma]
MGGKRGGGRGRGTSHGGGEGGDTDGWGGGGGLSDQYGECFKSQDRDDRSQFSHKSSGGGGSAGGKARPEHNLNFQRHVPKFLQKYQHLLGGRGAQPSEDEPAMDEHTAALMKRKAQDFEGYDEDDNERATDGGVEAEALKRAMAENPKLAKEFEETLAQRLAQAEAIEEKERGNRLFSEKKHEEAIKSFTKCIDLDPKNEVFYSNRSAAYAAIEQWEDALVDARKAASLKPSWAKAFQRMGAAYMALRLFSEAKEAYERAAKLEPDNQGIQNSLQKAEMMELQEANSNKHVFKKRIGDFSNKSSKPVPQEAGVNIKDSKVPKVAEDGVGTSRVSGSTSNKKMVLSFQDDE